MKVDIVKNKKTFFIRVFALITFVFGCLAYFAAINIGYLLIPLFQFIPLFISPNYFYQKNGSLEITEDEVIVSTSSARIIPLKNVISLKIFINDPKANDYSKKWIVKGFVVRMLIEAKEDFLQEYKLLIKKADRDNFVNSLEKLYTKHINIRERDDYGAKYFLLKGNLTYNEIQIIKSKYNLLW